ncbi:MAG: enoyl-CoA hydratase-related protein, partial [Gammaproteobacteria bacterium]
MSKKPCELTIEEHGIGRIRLDRPASRNALNPEMIAFLSDALQQAARNPDICSIELSSTDQTFCSGMDLRWLQASLDHANRAPEEEFYRLGAILYDLYHLPKPSIALVRGAAFGGGAGLVSCCDIVLASPAARFCFAEVRLGLIPSLISPFVIQALGERIARRYFLSGEAIAADEARRIGLVHEVVDDARLAARALELHRALHQGAPQSLSRIKALLTNRERMPLSPTTLKQTAAWLAESCNSEEAREGIAAFLAKR